MWDLYDATGRVRAGIRDSEARDLIIMAADPQVYIRNPETGTEIHWADVSSEPWPTDRGYGDPPPDWPYGN
jgi:hypothetical protein